jgi:hypothetical protein
MIRKGISILHTSHKKIGRDFQESWLHDWQGGRIDVDGVRRHYQKSRPQLGWRTIRPVTQESLRPAPLSTVTSSLLLLPVIHDVAARDDAHTGEQIVLRARREVSP